MKLLKTLLAVVLTLAVTLCACLRCPGASAASADANEDGKVTILDATAIQRYLAALPTHDRIGTLL